MKTVNIEADNLTFHRLNLGSNPVRLTFTGLDHAIIEDLYIEGNLQEVTEWPKSLRKLTLFNNGYCHHATLPPKLERLTVDTEHNYIDEFPTSIKYLTILGPEAYPSLDKLNKLEYLTVKNQRTSLFTLPKEIEWLTIAPEEERPDFSLLPKLKGISIIDGQGLILDVDKLALDTLELRNSSYHELRNLGDSIKCFTAVNCKFKERNIVLPEELKLLTFRDVYDFEHNMMPIPVTPSTVMYVNGSSCASRR